MLFSSNIFLFLFLPLYLSVYYLVELLVAKTRLLHRLPRQLLPNLTLRGLSLFFFFWCNGKFILVYFHLNSSQYAFGALDLLFLPSQNTSGHRNCP